LLSHGVTYGALRCCQKESECDGDQWWSAPSLNLLALDFATIPLSSAAAERVFRFCVSFSLLLKEVPSRIWWQQRVFATITERHQTTTIRLRQRENFGKKRTFFSLINFFFPITHVLFFSIRPKNTVLFGYNTCVILYCKIFFGVCYLAGGYLFEIRVLAETVDLERVLSKIGGSCRANSKSVRLSTNSGFFFFFFFFFFFLLDGAGAFFFL
jgi:hypothetical protein